MDRRRATPEDYMGFSTGLATLREAYRGMGRFLDERNPVGQHFGIKVGIWP